jgi:tRNA (guanine-N7-)-methyltransferase
MGVPIPGEILPQDQWVQTALKKLPESGHLPTHDIFGRKAPLVVDLGCGNGRFALGSAWSRKQMDHLAADILPVVIRYATRRGNQRGLSNLRFLVCDASKLVSDLLPPGSTAEIHCYHPQPYDDPRMRGQRLITPTFLAQCVRALEPGGQFFVQTDHAGYWSVIREMVARFFDFNERIGRWNDSPKGRTRREIHSLKKGMPIYRGQGIVSAQMTAEKAADLARVIEASEI